MAQPNTGTSALFNHCPALVSIEVRLEELLEEDWARPKKTPTDRRRIVEIAASRRVSRRLRQHPAFCQEVAGRERSRSGAGFIPLSFGPGEAYQFDWSHEWVVFDGVVQKAKVAHFRFCRSRHFFVVAYPRESMEMVLDAHNRAFAFFRGTCRRGIYDNMPTAVEQGAAVARRGCSTADFCSYAATIWWSPWPARLVPVGKRGRLRTR